MDFTILIQGRINDETLNFFKNNYLDFPVVISTWNDQIIHDDLPDNFTVIKSDKPSNAGPQNSNYQFFSTLTGLKNIKTKFCIKIRGDEFYSSVSHVFDIIKNNENKIFTLPIFFRPWTTQKYHISDHLIGGLTSNLLLMFELSYTNNCPEISLTKNYLKSKYNFNCDNDEEGIKLMMENFVILDINSFKPYKVVWNGNKSVWYDNFFPWVHNSISKIDDIILQKKIEPKKYLFNIPK